MFFYEDPLFSGYWRALAELEEKQDVKRHTLLRSMGAATAVLCASKQSQIEACVLDTPFCSLSMVAKELAIEFSCSEALTLTHRFVTGCSRGSDCEWEPVWCFHNA